MNSVSIIGILKEKIDDYFRRFEYELPYSDDTTNGYPKIVIKYWSNQPNSRLLVLPEGTKIAAHGHMDFNKEHGTILIIESFQSVK